MRRALTVSFRAAALVASAVACLGPGDRPAEETASVRQPLAWSESKDVLPPDTIAARRFGFASVLTADRLFVTDSAVGAIYAYARGADGTFTFATKLARAETQKPLSEVKGEALGDVFALAPPLVGTKPSVLLVFRPSGGTYTQVQTLEASDVREGFGRTVAFDGQTLAVGSPIDGGNTKGQVHTYERAANGTWTEGPAIGPPAEAVGQTDAFGWSVAFGPGGLLAISSRDEDQLKGAVYLYQRSGAAFTLVKRVALGADSPFPSGMCFVGSALLVASNSQAWVIRNGGSGWALSGTPLAPPGQTYSYLRCDGSRAAFASAGIGVNLFSPSGDTFTKETLPLAQFVIEGFALRGDTFVGAEDGKRVKVYRYAGLRGETCKDAAGCVSGFCVDGVCCDTACGGGDVADCQACSVAAGAKVDGTCAPVPSTRVCRAARGECDVEERCDGQGVTCPADAVVANGTVCATGTCALGVCSGSSSVGTPGSDAGTTEGAPASEGEGGCAVTGGAARGPGALPAVGLALLTLAGIRRRRARSSTFTPRACASRSESYRSSA